MRLIDTHCHLADARLARDVEAVLARAREAGVAAVICAAGDVAEARAAAELSRKYEGVYFTAGVHPHDAKAVPGGYLAQIEQLAGEAKCAAVGEVGLDYHYNFSAPQVQRRVFAEQLELARRLGKPIVVHTREAFDDTLAILAESGVEGSRVVFHSFTGSAAEAWRALEFGATLGFSGVVTFENAGAVRKAAAAVPDDKLLIETDAPYLSPEPVRKMKTNEPANVVHVAECLAAVRGRTPEAIAELTTANAVGFFGIDMPARDA
ncbi:MAG: TatD family hydrolase [Planctomycetota bacterium]|jgi:TatD DNase family protein